MTAAQHFTTDSIAALQEGTESYSVRLCEHMNLCAITVKSVPIIPKVIQPVRCICEGGT